MKSFMRKTVICVAFVLVLGTAISNQHDICRAESRAKTMMWSISSKSNTVYILGSIHAFHAKYYPLPHIVEEKYRQCNHIAFETKISPWEITFKEAEFLEDARYPRGETLEQNISERTLAILKRRLSRYDMKLNQVNRFKPWVVGSILSGIEFIRSGFRHEIGIDNHFLQKAERDNKQKYFLEPIEFQLSLLTGQSKEIQDQLLRFNLVENDVLDVTLHDLARAWCNGNIWRIEKYAIKPLKKYPEIYDLILVKRNKDWISKIESLLEKDYDFFVVVGCGHLVGEDSVLNMLEARGHVITRY